MNARRLGKSELSKMFLRPAVYFMTAFLVLTLVIISFSYNPTTRAENLTNFGSATQTVSEAFSSFDSATATANESKKVLDQSLSTTNSNILNYISNATAFNTLKEKVKDDIYPFMTNTSGDTFYYTLLCLSQEKNNPERKSNFLEALHTLSGKALVISQFLDNGITAKNIDFYASRADIEALKNTFFKLYQTSNTSVTDAEQLIVIGNSIRTNFDLTNTIKKIESFPKIDISQTELDNITANYYTNIAYQNDSETLLTKLYNDIKTFAESNSTSLEPDKKLELNKLITKYKNAVNISIALLQNSFEIQKAGNFSTNQVKNFIGFSEYNSYNLKENITLNKYLLDNQIFDGNYLLNFNISSTSGYDASAYNFCFFAMQILSIILTIFCLFYTVSILAGEQTNGTMKMLATRPFTRNQIINGKILACVYFMVVFVIVSVVASFVVGYTMFGLSNANVLLIFNAYTVISLPPFFVLLFYLISLSVGILFYICIAGLLSILFRSNIFAMFITFLIYFFGILFSLLYSGQFWYNFTPYAHLDFFKFFGNSNSTGTLLGMNMTIDGNFFVSLTYIVVAIILISVTTKIIFKNRDIA